MLLDLDGAAEFLSISKSYARILIRDGLLPVVDLSVPGRERRVIRFRLESLEEFCRERELAPFKGKAQKKLNTP